MQNAEYGMQVAEPKGRMQNAEQRMQNAERRIGTPATKDGSSETTRELTDLKERFLDLAAGCIRIAPKLTGSMPGRYIAGQLVRSGASSGANYSEARGAESRADFVHKMQVVLKELRETGFWLDLIERCRLMPEADLIPLCREADELTRIAVASIKTARSQLKSKASNPEARDSDQKGECDL
jgi:four helix bundle protein